MKLVVTRQRSFQPCLVSGISQDSLLECGATQHWKQEVMNTRSSCVLSDEKGMEHGNSKISGRAQISSID
jgi:hypothetical protein